MGILLLSVFLSLLLGFDLGIFLSVYHYPDGITLFSSIFPKITIILLIILILILAYYLISKKKQFFLISLIMIIFYLAFTYSFIISKNRIDKLISTPPSRFVNGYVKVSFLNKILLQSSNYNVWVYIKDHDQEFTRLGANVVVVGKFRHFYNYLTNKNFLSYSLYLLKDNVPFVLYSDEESFIDTVGEENIFVKVANDIRQNAVSVFENNLPLTHWLSSSLIIGESSDLSKEFYENIRKAGLSHIFSVSGFHVGVIVGVLIVLLNLFRIPKFLQFIIVSSFLAVYSIIVGMKPPVVRASVLASSVLLIRAINLNPNYLNITSITGIAMLMVDPFLSVDVGFILSFIALITIILFSRYINDAVIIACNKFFKFEMGNLSKETVSLFSVSFVATMFTLPIILIWFSKSSIVGIISSIIMVPLSSLNITSGMLSYISYLTIPTLGEIFFRATNLFNVVFIILTNYFSSIPLEISANLNFLYLFLAIPLYYYLLSVSIVKLPEILK